MADQLRELGADVTVEANETLGDTVVGVLDGAGSWHALLVGHMDTVFDAGTVAERPFTEREGAPTGRASTT